MEPVWRGESNRERDGVKRSIAGRVASGEKLPGVVTNCALTAAEGLRKRNAGGK
jgi:hypothetical protein